MLIRDLDPSRPAEVALVAARMRDTLIEVEGPARGAALYSLAWLEDRVRWHLDPAAVAGRVLVAEDAAGQRVGHTIFRVESPGDGAFGLISTTYVLPAARRQGLADRLLGEAEAWLRARGLPRACTATSATNAPLIALVTRRLTIDHISPPSRAIRYPSYINENSSKPRPSTRQPGTLLLVRKPPIFAMASITS